MTEQIIQNNSMPKMSCPICTIYSCIYTTVLFYKKWKLRNDDHSPIYIHSSPPVCIITGKNAKSRESVLSSNVIPPRLATHTAPYISWKIVIYTRDP